MLKFLGKILLFLLLPLLFLVFPCLVIVLGKEYLVGSDIVTAQNKDSNLLFYYAYNSDSNDIFKQALVKAKNPKIISYGTSRAMAWRKQFFPKPEEFVNAFSSGLTLADIQDHIQALPSASNGRPSLVIIALEREMLLYPQHLGTFSDTDPNWVRIAYLTVAESKKIYTDYFQKKFSLSQLISSYKKQNSIGILPVIKGIGFRSDGSLKLPIESNTKLRLRLLQDSASFFVGDSDFSLSPQTSEQKQIVEANLQILQNILKISDQKGIKVLAYLSPYHSVLYKTMNPSGNHIVDPKTASFEEYYSADNLLSADLEKMFARHNGAFFNLTDIKTFGANDAEFIDPGHGTDKLFLQALVFMAKNSSLVRQFVDLKQLNDLMSKQQGDYFNF